MTRGGDAMAEEMTAIIARWARDGARMDLAALVAEVDHLRQRVRDLSGIDGDPEKRERAIAAWRWMRANGAPWDEVVLIARSSWPNIDAEVVKALIERQDAAA